jgi:hypothetical protein
LKLRRRLCAIARIGPSRTRSRRRLV